jgi:phosphohistidine phosphatase
MKLYLLRHGIAADRDEWNVSDEERPLTPEGRKNMEREAKGMADLNVCPDRIITSPLKRAKETAEIVAERLDLKSRLVEDERLADSFDAGRLEQILSEHTDADSLMFVGHEPDFSHTIGELVGGASVDLKKGGLARIDVNDARSTRGELVWLLPPKALIR